MRAWVLVFGLACCATPVEPEPMAPAPRRSGPRPAGRLVVERRSDAGPRTCFATPDGDAECPEALVGWSPLSVSPDGASVAVIRDAEPGVSPRLGVFRPGDPDVMWVVPGGGVRRADAPDDAATARWADATTLVLQGPRDPTCTVNRDGECPAPGGLWRARIDAPRPCGDGRCVDASRLTEDPLGCFEPDGDAHGGVVFAASRDGNAEIYRLLADGAWERLTDDPADDLRPRLDPTGTRVAHLSNRGGRLHLRLVDLAGDRPLGEIPGEPVAVDWSAVGDLLAVLTTSSGGSVHLVDTSGTTSAPIPGRAFAWHATGRYLAVEVADDDGGTAVIAVHRSGVPVEDYRVAGARPAGWLTTR
jgi:hypothetical protein